jgi:hypothetical protein
MRAKKVFSVLFSLVIGLSISAAIYAYFLQFPIGSKRNLALMLIIVGFLMAGVYYSLEKILFLSFTKYTRPVRWILILGSLFIGIWMYYSLAFDEHAIYLMLPDRTLDVTIPIEKLPEEEKVSLQWFHIGYRDVSFSELQIDGEFNRTDEKLEFPGGQTVHLSWSGKTGSKTKLSFDPLTKPQEVQVSWNGDERTIYLDQSEAGAVNYLYEFEKPLSYKISNLFLIIPGLSFCFLFIVMSFAFWQPTANSAQAGRYAWLLYAIPMLVIWGIYLLAFWPGMMNVDAFVQWGQGLRGSYNDWHPAIHTLLIHILNSIWYSPAVVAIVQIIIASLITARGLGCFVEHGGARPVAWLFSGVMAILPTNGATIISLWKDTPYSIALLGLTVVVFMIVLSEGDWLNKHWNWLWLTLAGLASLLFRHNGIPVVAVVMLLLLIFYTAQRKPVLLSILTMGLLYWGIRGPLYSAMNVTRDSSGQIDNILFQYISAYYAADVPMSDAELEYLDDLLPLHEWTYNCCAKKTFDGWDEFDDELFYENSSFNKQMVGSLLLRDPMVGIDHLLCASSMVWKIAPGCYQKGITLYYDSHSRLRWLARNWYDLKEDSKIPWLANWVAHTFLLDQHSFVVDVLLWKTPFYLLLTLTAVGAVSLRFRNWKYWLIATPTVTHSGVMFLLNRVQSFRYQYPVVLIAVFLLCLLFLPVNHQKKDSNW